MNRPTPLEMITYAAECLGDLRDEVVFLGGASVGLLITEPAAPAPRMTRDVDVVMEILSRLDFYRAEQRLQSLGFQHDLSGPVGRFLNGPLVLDLLPSDAQALGFGSRWYALAIKTAWQHRLTGGTTIRVISGPCFLATKLEAFQDPQREHSGDLFISRDFEDIVRVIDGRPGVVEEIHSAPQELRDFLAQRFQALLQAPYLYEAIAAHTDPGREPALIDQLRLVSLRGIG
jgi:hypothetical protein